MFELGEDLLNRVQVRAVGGQEQQVSLGFADRLSHGLSLVAPEIVDHRHITGAQGWNAHVLDGGPECFAVHWTVQNERRVDPIMTQRCDEGHGAPVTMWCAPDQAFAFGCPTPQRCHVGLGPCFINEHEAARVDPALMSLPAGTAATHVWAVLFLGALGLF